MKHGDAGPFSLRGWVGSRGGFYARRARIKRVGAVRARAGPVSNRAVLQRNKCAGVQLMDSPTHRCRRRRASEIRIS